jgi:hypothetical protein
MSFLNRHRRIRGSEPAERGSSLIALLLVVLILGVTAAVALGGLGYTPNSTITGIPSTMPGGGAIVAATSTTVVAKSRNNNPRESPIAACRADYAIVRAAVQKYEKINGSLPAAGTAWASSSANGGPLLGEWPRGEGRFTIVWNGSMLSVVPAVGTATHGSMGTKAPPTGCFAV